MAIETNADVAGRVRGIAAERRVSQSRLAEVLNVSTMGVSRRINGNTPLTAEELIKLAKALGTPVAAFFGEVPASGGQLPVISAPVDSPLTRESAGAFSRSGDAA